MALLQELDTGTPIRTGEATVTVTIDGRKVSVPPGTSVMAAAALINNPIPKLCATDSLEAFGSCRLCLVEIEGRKGTPASCTTPAEAGMVVHTRTARLQRLRRGVMELYASDHPSDTLISSANGDSEFQTQAAIVSMLRSTPPIPISPSTPRRASCARAACAPVRRCRARSR